MCRELLALGGYKGDRLYVTLPERFHRNLERFRLDLAGGEALFPLSLVGVSSGLLTGAVILAFRFLVESLQTGVLPLTNPEHYEVLSWHWRLLLPVVGALLIAALYHRVQAESTQVGVLHVMERLAYHNGYLPLRNAVMQFVGAGLSITAGHSVGREGPGIHLGAASSSLLGQWLRLPNNSLRTLIACGTAASIAASFNTPIAGVIFAMEVVMMEYTIVGFIPVILAAVMATSLTHAVYGADPAFSVPLLRMASLWELPYIVFLGAVIGTIASSFIHLLVTIQSRFLDVPFWARFGVAGLVTGLCALAVPEIMGIGYDTIELTLLGEMGLGLVLLVALFKLIATTACVGLGLPGGLIGPTLIIGATAGGALGIVGHAIIPDQSASSGLYALLGMGAMMGATLQAPLAALMAILELTHNPQVIMPAMLAIVTACLTSKVLFKKDSVFVTVLRERGIDYCHDPVAVSLSRTGVTAVMDRRFVCLSRDISLSDAQKLLEATPSWIVITQQGQVLGLLLADHLTQYLESQTSIKANDSLDLLCVPEIHPPVASVPMEATLSEALQVLDHKEVGVMYVTQGKDIADTSVLGVLTRDAIESSMRRLRQ